MRILFILMFAISVPGWTQKMTGFWQGMLFTPTDETLLIPVYLDIYVTNGTIDGKIRIENKEGASVYQVVGKYENNDIQLITTKAMWSYLPEFSLAPMVYTLKFNAQNGYLEGLTDRQDFRFIAYQSKGEISLSKISYLPKDWLRRFQQELKDGISAPQIRKQELLNFVFQPIYFNYDQANIKTEYHIYLKDLIRMVKSHSDLRIEITGHTDADGSDAYNMLLSEKRCQMLISFFEQNGLSRDRIVFEFKGEKYPVQDNSTEEGKRFNRRVDFRFI